MMMHGVRNSKYKITYADGQTLKILHYADVVKGILVYVLEPITLSTQQPPILGM
jgi:hypothetical protein